jgi:hypothetical protein
LHDHPAIPRPIFRQAIEAGIAAVEDTADVAVYSYALRDLARTATEIGTNFDFGCPAAKVGLYAPYDDDEHGDGWHAAMEFAYGYDKVLLEALDWYGAKAHPVVKVTD